MTTGESLLQAIIADPDDNLVRLAYADWLEENSLEWHARLIRGERDCSLSVYGDHLERLILGGLPGFSGMDSDSNIVLWSSKDGKDKGWLFRLRMGFIEEVRCPQRAWLGHGRQIVQSHPIQQVDLTDKNPWQTGHGEYVWFRFGNWEEETDDLDPALFDCLTDGRLQVGNLCARRVYLSEADAIADLRAACLVYARTMAGVSSP